MPLTDEERDRMTTKPMPCAIPVLNDDERAYLMELIEKYRQSAQDRAICATLGLWDAEERHKTERDQWRAELRSALGFDDREKDGSG